MNNKQYTHQIFRRWILICTFGIFISLSCAGQTRKAIIDSISIFNWPNIVTYNISSDGKFFSYRVDENPNFHTMIYLSPTDLSYQYKFVDAVSLMFTNDSKYGLVRNSDTLFVVNLKKKSVDTLSSLESYSLLSQNRTKWLACKAANSTGGWIQKVDGGSRLQVKEVSEFVISPKGKILSIFKNESGNSDLVRLFDWQTQTWTTLCKARNIEQVSFDKYEKKIVFLANRDAGDAAKSAIYCLNLLDLSLDKIIEDGEIDSIQIKEHTQITFSYDDQSIYFEALNSRIENKDKSAVKIWIGSSPTLSQNKTPNVLLYKALLGTKKLTKIIGANEQLVNSFNFNLSAARKLIIQSPHGAGDEINWNPQARRSFFVVDLNTGQRKLIVKESIYPVSQIVFSNDQANIIYYDATNKSYYSYNIDHENRINLTSNIADTWILPLLRDIAYPEYHAKGVCGFIGNRWVLIKSQYDLWKIDIYGEQSPVNLTNGLGASRKIEFSLAPNSFQALQQESKYIFYAFDKKDKSNGFYSRDASGRLIKLSSIPKLIDPIFLVNKSRTKFIIRAEDASNSANLFISDDLRKFYQITFNAPEKKYNWLKAELHNWKLDNDSLQGVLYKPEDFDNSKRYPVILYYYENMSDNLHQFKTPDYGASSVISIPSFVSQGYLVFAVDIHYKLGEPGKSALKCVNSAADYLKTFAFIDTAKMGINGHSFGGFETNYIITHSHRYKAAYSGAGMSELISEFGSLWGGDGVSKNALYEFGQVRMPGAPWDFPNQYVENSPIFSIKNISTPLLMMQNKSDGAVSYHQGVQFFTALRRLAKPVWMLEYTNGSHALNTEEDILDFQNRLLGFFNYYLKSEPKPQWMLNYNDATNKIDLSPSN